MKILDWYIARILLSTSAITLLILTGLSGIIKWVDQFRLVGRGTYGMIDALIYVMYLVPRDVEMFFPMAVLLGALIGIGMMAQSSELVVMQASGWSRFEVIQSVMKTAIPLMIMVMALGEWVAPEAERTGRELQANKIHGGSLINSKRGTWAKDGDLFVNITEVESATLLKGVIQYRFDDNQNLVQVVAADEAEFIDGVWKMRGVKLTALEEEQVNLQQVEQRDWHSSLTPDKLSVVSVKPEALSISGLMGYLDYLKDNKQDPSRYELALWRKLMQPVTVAVMMLMALSFVFSPIRTSTMGARVLIGVIAGFSYYVSSEVLGTVSLVYQLPPAIGAVAPSLLFTGIAVWLLRR
ncbi:LPS export ABC transporter permease LptG [Paraferrimonas sedimenticola]|nr:LPS export ABC transporter permease LptG [Paraferrimonas sedimenticola]